MATADELIGRLDETRQRWWLYSMLCNVIATIAVSVGMLATFIFADVMFQLSRLWLAALVGFWLVATFFLVARTIYGILRNQRDVASAARQAELSYPELASDLINLVQLSNSSNGAPESFRQAAIADAAARASRVPFHRAAERLSAWWRWRLSVQTPRDVTLCGVGLFALFAAVTVLSMLFPTWSSSVDRLFTPWEFVPQVGSVRIVEVTPGDAEVLAGTQLDIAARIENTNATRHDATLYVIADDGTETAHAMFANESCDTYAFSFPAVLTPIQYRLQIGDSQSDVYNVTVHQKPTIETVEVTYEYPKYLNRPNDVVQQGQADLTAPQYTVAHLKLRCSTELSRGYAQLAAGTVGGNVEPSDPRTLRLSVPMTEQSSYTIHLFNASGHTDDEPRVNGIRVVEDSPPTVQLVKPPRESAVAPGQDVTVIVRAADDYGLSEVRIETKLAESEAAQSDGSPHVVKNWNKLGGAANTTRTHALTIDSRHYDAGQSLLVRAVAVDRRRYASRRVRLEPQQRASGWHRIRLIEAQLEATEDLKRWESITAKLSAILRQQLRTRIVSAQTRRDKELSAAVNRIQGVRQQQIRIQTDTSALAKSINADEGDVERALKQALAKLARGEMFSAVNQAEDAERITALADIPARLGPLEATQDRIIDVLRRLLQETRQATSELLAEMDERPGGDLPDDVADKLRELKDKLDEFIKQQRRVIEASEDLAKRPVEDFTAEEEQLLQQLAEIEDEWSRFLEDTHSDFSKLPEQDFANPSMLEELIEVQTEIKMAGDALTKKAADIAVPLEQLGAEMAEELVSNIEKWLPDTPDRDRWSQEEPLTDEMKEAPMAELPGELEDLVGELMEEEEDLFDELEDASSSWADSLDKGAGWDAADGPISNMSAKGVTGNRLPNSSEIGGRSGEGRQGKASGEFVGDTAVGKGGRRTPSRLNPDPFVEGQVKDVSQDPVGGATGGGKESGAGGEGLEGPVPSNPQRELARLAKRQADLRNRAESIDLKFQVLNYHHTDLKRLTQAMAAVESDLRSGRYQSALRRREVLLDGLDNIKTYLEGEFQIRQDQTSNLPDDIQKELLSSMQDESPAGWEALNRRYFQSLASEEQAGAPTPLDDKPDSSNEKD